MGLPFSVVICTRNRATALAQVLDSIAAAEPPGVGWELVVVDNGSTDDTPATIDKFAGRLPIRRVSEPTPGLSNARNRGVEAARGDFILWTDDDVLVRSSWLRAFAEAFAAHPDKAIFGGIVLPLYAEPRADWFVKAEDQLRTLLAYRNFSGPISLDRMPFGACYAVRGVEQRRHRYDPELGVAPGRRTGGEETAVLNAIFAEGGSGVWVPEGIVDHVISLERQTLDYIFTFYRAHGRQHPDRPIAPRPALIGGAPVRAWAALPKRYFVYRAKRVLGRNWVGAWRDYARAVGMIDAWKGI